MDTYKLRTKLIDIARKDVGNVEVSKNRGEWIKKLWPATSYPEGYANCEPYCAAGVAYCTREWYKIPEVKSYLNNVKKITDIEKWRCKSAAVFDWEKWAKTKNLQILKKDAVLHTGDLVIYTYSHIEIVVDDNPEVSTDFIVIGYNTDDAASREGDGCFEKPRSRTDVKCFIRIIP